MVTPERPQAYIPTLTVWLLGLVALALVVLDGRWRFPEQVIAHDVVDYYGYLPAAFIQHDLRLEFADAMPAPPGTWWQARGPRGHRVFKMTSGLALLYLPFFLLAHVLAEPLGFAANGFTRPYALALLLAGCSYLVLGLWALSRWLKAYASPLVIAATLVVVVLGTNLLYYASTEAAMPHVFLFALLCLMLWQTERFWKKPSLRGALFLGLLWGMATLVRPTHALTFLLIFGYGVTSSKSLHARITWLHTYPRLWFPMALVAITLVTIQLLYWQHTAGHWLFFSYGDERFFWADPKLWQGLFSGRKGWLLYTPLMAIALAGIALRWKALHAYRWAVPLYFGLHLYITFCWWCWWYGGSFGLRALIDFYGLLALPLALVLERLFTHRRLVAVAAGVLLVGGIYLNLHHTRLYRKGMLHWDSMTYRAYLYVRPGNDFDAGTFQQLLSPPDYAAAKAGER